MKMRIGVPRFPIMPFCLVLLAFFAFEAEAAVPAPSSPRVAAADLLAVGETYCAAHDFAKAAETYLYLKDLRSANRGDPVIAASQMTLLGALCRVYARVPDVEKATYYYSEATALYSEFGTDKAVAGGMADVAVSLTEAYDRCSEKLSNRRSANAKKTSNLDATMASQACALLTSISASRPGDAEIGLKLGRALFHMASIRCDAGDFSGALAICRQIDSQRERMGGSIEMLRIQTETLLRLAEGGVRIAEPAVMEWRGIEDLFRRGAKLRAEQPWDPKLAFLMAETSRNLILRYRRMLRKQEERNRMFELYDYIVDLRSFAMEDRELAVVQAMAASNILRSAVTPQTALKREISEGLKKDLSDLVVAFPHDGSIRYFANYTR